MTARGELPVEGNDHELLDPQRGDQVALDGKGVEQLRRGLGMDDPERMGVEGEDRVGAADDLAVAEVDTVEGADGDPPRPWLGVGE